MFRDKNYIFDLSADSSFEIISFKKWALQSSSSLFQGNIQSAETLHFKQDEYCLTENDIKSDTVFIFSCDHLLSIFKIILLNNRTIRFEIPYLQPESSISNIFEVIELISAAFHLEKN